MAFLMLVFLIAILLVAYLTGKKDLLSPWFLLCLMFTATFVIVLFNYANWEISIGIRFVLYVSTAIVSFGIGCALIQWRFSSVKALQTDRKVFIDDAEIQRRYPVYLLLIISCVLSALYIYRLLSSVSDVASFGEKLRKIYDNTVNGYTPGFLFNQMREIVTAIAYVNTYRLMVKLFSRKDRVNLFALGMPILLFVCIVLVTSDRNIFLRYAFYFICLYVLFFRENYRKKNANIKIIQKVIILGLIAIGVFFLLGKLKQYSSDIFRSISIYAGSGLYNYNLWLSHFNEPLMFGTATFSTFLRSFKTIFGYIGIDLDIQTLNRFDAFIEYTSSNGYVYSSNIYSALKPFTEDFGYLGVVVFPFLIGAFYQWLYAKAKRSKYRFGWVLYSMLIYPVLFFPIAEQLFGRFTLGFVYELFWLGVVYYLAIGRRQKAGKRKEITLISEDGKCRVSK